MTNICDEPYCPRGRMGRERLEDCPECAGKSRAVADEKRVVEIPTALAIIEQLIDAVPDQGNDFENGRLSGLYSAKHALEDAAADSASNVSRPTDDAHRVLPNSLALIEAAEAALSSVTPCPCCGRCHGPREL